MANIIRSLLTVSGKNWERHYLVETKWEPPLRVVEEISRHFPDIEIAVIWSGQSLDQTGEIHYKDGREMSWYYPEDTNDDANEIYKRIWNIA